MIQINVCSNRVYSPWGHASPRMSEMEEEEEEKKKKKKKKKMTSA